MKSVDYKYYDPSYGTAFDSQLEWENASLSGFIAIKHDGVGFVTVGKTKDTTKTETIFKPIN